MKFYCKLIKLKPEKLVVINRNALYTALYKLPGEAGEGLAQAAQRSWEVWAAEPILANINWEFGGIFERIEAEILCVNHKDVVWTVLEFLSDRFFPNSQKSPPLLSCTGALQKLLQLNHKPKTNKFIFLLPKSCLGLISPHLPLPQVAQTSDLSHFSVIYPI